MKLAKLTSYGMSSLPDDEEILQKRILKSEDCFAKKTDKPRGETYLFALENLDKGKMIGVCGIVSKVGVGEPFYTYKIETAVHESEKLKVRRKIQFLTPVSEHNGPCEIGSLYLSPENRKSGLGRFLSLSRFLFMAENTDLFDPIVIAKMRGVIEKDGSSAFWNSVGKHFFDIKYTEANYLSMINKQFIAELLPKHPIYIQLLPKDAQKVIGKVHKNTKPALKILMDEGFKFDNMVSIFAAGPILCCNIRYIRSVKESIKITVAQIKDKKIKSELFIISNTSKNYRACVGHIKIDSSGTAQLEKETASALRVEVGNPVRFVPLYPPSHPERQSKKTK